jgi:hypothetical protein
MRQPLRLTLRTLLAYLDDMLEPEQARDIGARVAESEMARELVERIRKVTRRRRLSSPPLLSEGEGDPNLVAEYLDNVLSPQEVAEVEERCLQSDLYLAELASCHQILSLVVGEPAYVPPTARSRMYGLVRGRESFPNRTPAANADAAADRRTRRPRRRALRATERKEQTGQGHRVHARAGAGFGRGGLVCSAHPARGPHRVE